MNKYSQIPPVLIARAISLFFHGRVHPDKSQIGNNIQEDEAFIIFRKIIVDPTIDRPATPQAIFKVYFKFAKFSTRVNKVLSLIPIPFIIAQPGFRSKTWMTGKETGTFQGLYEWDSVEDAQKYWNSLPLRMMKARSIPNTLKHEVIDLKAESKK